MAHGASTTLAFRYSCVPVKLGVLDPLKKSRHPFTVLGSLSCPVCSSYLVFYLYYVSATPSVKVFSRYVI